MNLRLTTLTLPLLVLAWSPNGNAQDEDPGADEETRRCISTRSIRRTRIVDDQNVLIYLSASNIYHNQLESACRGLKQVGTFSYSSSDGLLCTGDGIAAINSTVLDDVRPVPQCWLGVHRKISKEEADAMRDAARRGIPIEAMPLPLPEPAEVSEKEDEAES